MAFDRGPLRVADSSKYNGEYADEHSGIRRTTFVTLTGFLLFIFGPALVNLALCVMDNARPTFLQKGTALGIWLLASLCIAHAVFLLLTHLNSRRASDTSALRCATV